MNFDNDEEALGLFNRLLEQLHQAGINKNDLLFRLRLAYQTCQHVEGFQPVSRQWCPFVTLMT